MIFGKTKLELKVGIFVFVGVIILSFFVLSIGKVKNWTSGYRVGFIYNFVNGVKIGAPVRFAGVDVGDVRSIKLVFVPEEQKTKIHIFCWINKDIKIPVDSTVWVNTLGLLGEKYIEIMAGKDYNHCLPANHSMVGVDPIPMHEVFRLSKSIADTINESFTRLKNGEGTVGKLLYDDALYKELEAAIRNKNGTVGRFFYDDSIYKDVESLIRDLRSNPWKLFWKTKEKPQKK